VEKRYGAFGPSREEKGVLQMTKDEMIANLSREAGLKSDQAEKALNSILHVITDELAKGGKVNLSGLGSFSVVERKAREGRNPRTGEKIQIPKRKGVKFSPSKNLKDKVE
jgi:DNA-binding protein HU-beta